MDDTTTVPNTYEHFKNGWATPTRRADSLVAYQNGQHSFVPTLLPEDAMRLTVVETLAILRERWGERIELALERPFTNPDRLPKSVPDGIRSPTAALPDTRWLKTTNMAGINVRTVGDFFGVVKYALTLSEAQDSIHLLPIWEPGVVGSIYGMSSWQLNNELYSHELAEAVPWLNSLGHQLRAVVNLLHVMGKAVGMDVIPHTDRFSEMVLAYPDYFEWVQRQDITITDAAPDLYKGVQHRIIEFLAIRGTAVIGDVKPRKRDELFGEEIPEAHRLRILFGLPEHRDKTLVRRKQLIRWLYQYGYETIPATMAPPYRGIAVDPNPEAMIVDADGLVWRDYLITQPEPMSRVFGPLTRYKLYERIDRAESWALDFTRPYEPAWRYVKEHYADNQRRYGFDFMRGDMSHVQMRPEGVPAVPDDYYDILGAVKTHIQRENNIPSFGYFAETFLAPPDVMGYGVEIDHLEAAEADTTLGDLQSTVLGSAEFITRLRQYDDLARTRLCVPNFTVMTADKDDPRFDLFYRTGNEARLLMALCLTDMPSYTGLGFETRDVHMEPAPNEHYTKLFVFHEVRGPKSRRGPYHWGQNGALFANIMRLKLYVESIWARIQGRTTRWLLPPDATVATQVMAWTQYNTPAYVFIVNTHPTNDAIHFALPYMEGTPSLICEFSTTDITVEADRSLTFNGKHYHINHLAAGEGRVYRVNV